MPTLNWIGKDKVINHHTEVPFHTLKKMYEYPTPHPPPLQGGGALTSSRSGSETPLPKGEGQGVGSKIIHGDNLIALKSLLSEYENQIKCIYIDPPYNTGNENWVYNDNVNSPELQAWLGKTVGKEAEDLSRHDKWLCMMYPRLTLLRKLLKNDGVIFISIDDNEQANLKLLCDEIFGSSNFVTQLIWQKRKGGGNDSFYVATDHEYILIYTKKETAQTQAWRVAYESDYLKRYKQEDEKGKYYWDTLSRAGLNNPIIYDIVCPDGTIIKDGTWQISEKTFKEYLEINEVGFIKNKNDGYTVMRKVRMPEGKVFRSILSEVTNKDAADQMFEIFGNKQEFSTPKPYQLIEKLLELSTKNNDIILDSFAGSGTTAHAVLNLNKADGGERKFILIECQDYAETITAERVRRIISPQGLQALAGISSGFSFYKLGEPLLIDEQLNNACELEDIRKYIWHTETGNPTPCPSPSGRGVFAPLPEGEGQGVGYFLGSFNETDIYFYYEKDKATYLDYDFLATISQKAEYYLIYADVCYLSKEFMEANHIRFKKIPRDITRI